MVRERRQLTPRPEVSLRSNHHAVNNGDTVLPIIRHAERLPFELVHPFGTRCTLARAVALSP
jgi:hypothetical protein